MPVALAPYLLALLTPILAGTGYLLWRAIRWACRRLASAAGRKARTLVCEAVESTPVVQQVSEDVGTMRGQLDRLAQRVLVLENRRPGGRRRTDPAGPANGIPGPGR